MTAVNLWPFQRVAKDAVRDCFARGIRRPLLCSPTGSGKTEVAMSIIGDMSGMRKRCAFFVDRQTLVRQTARRFAEAGIGHGMIMGNETHTSWSPIQVVSSQTFESRGWSGPKPELVIVDECHEIRKKVVRWIRDENLRALGLTATPLTAGLGEWWDTIVNTTTTQRLITDGYLAPLRVIGPEHIVDTAGLATSGGEWKKDDLAKRVLRIVGDLVPTWKEQTTKYFGSPVQTIVFCVSVADAQKTADAFQEAGYDFRVVHYKQSAEEKQRIIEQFRRNVHVGLISCVALTKGFDVPAVRCLVDAYPLRSSLSIAIQKWGRVMRRADAKDFGLVIDHAENFERFYDDATVFFQSGVDDFTERIQKKEGKVETVPGERKCLDCRIVLQPTEYECPVCGRERMTRRDAQILRYGGDMVLIAELIGGDSMPEGPVDKSWWWQHIVRACCEEHLGNSERARKKAYAVYFSMFGDDEMPPGYFRFTSRPPHPAARKLLRESFLRWKRSRQRQTA